MIPLQKYSYDALLEMYCVVWYYKYKEFPAPQRTKLSKDVLEVLDQKPVVLPPWDPMGSLANISELAKL